MNSIYESFKGRQERWKTRQILLAQHLKVTNPRELSNLTKTKSELLERKEFLNKLKEKKRKLMKEFSSKQETQETEGQIKEKEKEEKEIVQKRGHSGTPQNDYCQHYIDTGDRPQNFIRDVGLKNRFEEYPKLRELILKKDQLIQRTNTAPMYLKCDFESFNMQDLNCKFDVILLEPPLEEYQGVHDVNYKHWNWKQIENLAIDQIASSRSFLWMWCGSGSGLDAGRSCLKKWGFRRCEDICWIKTNAKRTGPDKNYGLKSIFQRSKEHCLMGIKGTVRRSTDGEFIHANVDIDLIIEEEPLNNSDDKPQEIFHIIEHFCLGRRRLHLFGKDASVRPGWLTIGPHLTSSNFESQRYNNFFSDTEGGLLTGCAEDIERLRPKSPPPKGSNQNRNMHSNKQSSNISAVMSSTLIPPPSLMMMAAAGHMMPSNQVLITPGAPNAPWNVQR